MHAAVSSLKPSAAESAIVQRTYSISARFLDAACAILVGAPSANGSRDSLGGTQQVEHATGFNGDGLDGLDQAVPMPMTQQDWDDMINGLDFDIEAFGNEDFANYAEPYMSTSF